MAQKDLEAPYTNEIALEVQFEKETAACKIHSLHSTLCVCHGADPRTHQNPSAGRSASEHLALGLTCGTTTDQGLFWFFNSQAGILGTTEI